MTEIADIRKQMLCRDLTESELGLITGKLIAEEYPKGKVIFKEGEPAECIFLVCKGRVEISKTTADGWKQRLVVFGENHFFGELSVIEHKKQHGADAIALDNCKVYKVMAADLMSLEKSNPGVMYKIMRTIARVASTNLHAMNEKLIKLLVSY